MFVHDTATWKDPLLLIFASAVTTVAIATPLRWRRKGIEGMRVGRLAGGRREGGREVDYKSVSIPFWVWWTSERRRQTAVLNCGEGKLLCCCYDSCTPLVYFFALFLDLFLTFMLNSFVFTFFCFSHSFHWLLKSLFLVWLYMCVHFYCCSIIISYVLWLYSFFFTLINQQASSLARNYCLLCECLLLVYEQTC